MKANFYTSANSPRGEQNVPGTFLKKFTKLISWGIILLTLFPGIIKLIYQWLENPIWLNVMLIILLVSMMILITKKIIKYRDNDDDYEYLEISIIALICALETL